MLDTRALQMVLALAEELHFGRTADRLGISQSVLSMQVLRTEDRIGTRLFERGRRSAVSVTAAGRTFLAEARAAVAQMERAERIGRMAGRGEAGPAQLGFVLSAALSGCLTQALAAIRLALPDLDIRAEPMETPEQIAAIADARLDLGFLRPRATYPANVCTRVVHSERMLIALAANHPLAGETRIAPAALARETFIFPQFTDTEGFGDTIERLSAAGLFRPEASLRTRDFVTAVSLAAAGYGIVLAPRSIAYLGIAGIVFRPLAGHDDEAQLAVAWREGANPRVLDVVLSAFDRS